MARIMAPTGNAEAVFTSASGNIKTIFLLVNAIPETRKSRIEFLESSALSIAKEPECRLLHKGKTSEGKEIKSLQYYKEGLEIEYVVEEEGDGDKTCYVRRVFNHSTSLYRIPNKCEGILYLELREE